MKTSEEEIIKWLSRGIKPQRVKHTVENALKQGGKKGRARRKRLTTFHRLLKKLAKRFYEAKAMGMGADEKPSTEERRPRKRKQRRKRTPEADNKNDDGDASPPVRKRELKCYHWLRRQTQSD